MSELETPYFWRTVADVLLSRPGGKLLLMVNIRVFIICSAAMILGERGRDLTDGFRLTGVSIVLMLFLFFVESAARYRSELKTYRNQTTEATLP